jgi:hypothetical protein
MRMKTELAASKPFSIHLSNFSPFGKLLAAPKAVDFDK